MLRSKSRRKTGPSEATQRIVWERADFGCERCGAYAPNHGGQIHHRRPRGAGGTRRPTTNEPINLVLLCADCHRHVESHRAEAKAAGWLVAQWEAPETVPLTTLDGRQFILDGEWKVWLP